MKWLALHIDTSPAGLEPVEIMLGELGIHSLVVEDEADFHAFLENNRQYWDYVDEDLVQSMAGKCRVTFYVEHGGPGFAQVAAVRMAMAELKKAHPEYAPMLLTMDDVEDADWENNWRAFYKPMEIGERLLVVPCWEEKDPGARVELRLDPGLAFGTGGHATTRLCLTALEKLVGPGTRVLDLGCGSGILSIAALLLGAEWAFGCDIDEKAVEVARSNANRNGVAADRYALRAGDVLTDQGLRRAMGTGYHIVAANIVADVIISLAATVGSLLAEDGVFLCSGIIEERGEEVRAALEAAGFAVAEESRSEGWRAFLCKRRERPA